MLAEVNAPTSTSLDPVVVTDGHVAGELAAVALVVWLDVSNEKEPTVEVYSVAPTVMVPAPDWFTVIDVLPPLTLKVYQISIARPPEELVERAPAETNVSPPSVILVTVSVLLERNETRTTNRSPAVVEGMVNDPLPLISAGVAVFFLFIEVVLAASKARANVDQNKSRKTNPRLNMVSSP